MDKQIKKQKDYNRLPRWVERTLQGLAFWIGHRHALYYGHPLPEGALVAETCNLIQANFGSDKRLICECTYKKLVAPGAKIQKLGGNERADLVVIGMANRKKITETSNLSELAQMVIEVKRGSANKKKIEEDIERLAMLKLKNPKVQTLLFVVSESKLPKDYVTGKGYAKRGIFYIGDNVRYKVRRVCKATASFKVQRSAHYACVIEAM